MFGAEQVLIIRRCKFVIYKCNNCFRDMQVLIAFIQGRVCPVYVDYNSVLKV